MDISNFEIYPNWPVDDKPIRHKRTLIVKILVFELDTDEQIREHKIDFFDEKQLAWFKNMLFWSTMNYKYVVVSNIKDNVKFNGK